MEREPQAARRLRLPLVVGLGLGVAMPSAALESRPCATLFQIHGQGWSERAVLERYAPQFLHWAGSDPALLFQDLVTSMEFDDDRRSDNNYQNAPLYKDSLGGVLYGSILAATRNQLYVLYYYFHPIDYGNRFERWINPVARRIGVLGTFWHENDLEGGLLVIDRADGRIIHATALHHGDWDERHLGGAPVDARRSYVWVEAGGHGGYLFRREEAPRPDMPGSRANFLRLALGGVPSTGREAADRLVALDRDDLGKWREAMDAWEWTPAWRFEVVSLWPLFRGMFDGGGPEARADDRFYASPKDLRGMRFKSASQPPRVSIYTALKGDDGGTDSAHLPWGEAKKGKAEDYARFFDPVQAVLKQEDSGARCHPHQPIACVYEYNPYLQSILTGEPTGPSSETAEASCPVFPRDPHVTAGKHCLEWLLAGGRRACDAP